MNYYECLRTNSIKTKETNLQYTCIKDEIFQWRHNTYLSDWKSIIESYSYRITYYNNPVGLLWLVGQR